MNGQAKNQIESRCVPSAKVLTGTEIRKFTIYRVTNRVNGKVYIGQTVQTLKARKGDHIARSKRCPLYCFHNALKKYGADSFLWEIICFCLSRDDADAKESKFIKVFNSKVPAGYNMTDGGEGTLGCHPSEETKAKSSKAQKMYIQRTGKINFLGMKHTVESRAKISAAQTGKKRGPHSVEHRENIRKALQGRKLTEEQKAKISKGLTGLRHSKESCDKMSRQRKGRKCTEEVKENMRRAWVIRKQKKKEEDSHV